MSSHLLGEIERVCNYLVVIDGGKLMRSDSISSFTATKQVLSIEIDGKQEELAARLRHRGLEASVEGRFLSVSIEGVEPYDIIRDEIVAAGVGLLRLEQQRYRLEDIFRADEADT
jgi:ABC-2 type transport system ATP-binding protein